ncbi:MAG: acetylesterase [Oscillospiraceae bacterium]|nr:acetylesterase [Oscillospiraceae bacterium]
MAVFQFSFFSSSLHRNTDVTAVIPAGGPVFQMPGQQPPPAGPLRLLVLLHGYGGHHSDWVGGSSIDQLASMHRMAIICPSCENSFYIDDTKRDALYEQFICRELPKFAREVFHISDKVEDTFIGGLSMGGYGAIRNGLKNPDVFGGILAFSSALITDGISHMPDEPQPAPQGPGGGGGGMGMSPSYFIHTFGKPSQIIGSDVDPKALAKKLIDAGAAMPKLYMACGAEDFLIDPNRDLHKYFEEIGYKHFYVEGPGTHSWEYWNKHIADSLNWIDGKLETKAE